MYSGEERLIPNNCIHNNLLFYIVQHTSLPIEIGGRVDEALIEIASSMALKLIFPQMLEGTRTVFIDVCDANLQSI